MNQQNLNHNISIGELLNKRIVLFTLCGIAWMLSFVMAYCAVKGMAIPEPLDRLVTFVLGNISGSLIQTGLNRAAAASPTAKEIGQSVVEESQKAEGLSVKEVDPQKSDEVGE